MPFTQGPGLSVTASANQNLTLGLPPRAAGDLLQFIIEAPGGVVTPVGFTVTEQAGDLYTFQKVSASAGGSGGTFTIKTVGAGLVRAVAQAISTVTGRDSLVLGVDKPSTSNTGLLPGVALTVTSTHVPADNTTYENLQIENAVNLGGRTNVTYKNCWFRGAAANPSTASSLVRAFGIHGRGHVFIDCFFQPQVPHFNWNGIQGYGYTLRRCRFDSCTDGLDLFNNNNGPGGSGDNTLRNGPLDVTVEQCLFDRNAWFPQSIDTGGGPIGSHSDQVQWQGGTGVTMRGNTFTGMIGNEFGPNSYGTYQCNATWLIKPDVGTISGLVGEMNWLDGGSYTINGADDAPDRYLTNLGSLTDNRFGRNQRIQGPGGDQTFTVSVPDATTGTFSGNVYDDNDHAIRIRGAGF